jgi:hypothetical protein
MCDTAKWLRAHEGKDQRLNFTGPILDCRPFESLSNTQAAALLRYSLYSLTPTQAAPSNETLLMVH